MQSSRQGEIRGLEEIALLKTLIGDWHDLKPHILSSADLHVAEIVGRAVAREDH
jgi:hypothetical protein